MGVILQLSLVTATLVMCDVSLAFNITDNDRFGCTIYNYDIFCWDDDGVPKVGGPKDRIKNCGIPEDIAFEHHTTTNCCLEEGSMDIACLAEHKNISCTVGYVWEHYSDVGWKGKAYYFMRMREPLTIFFRDPKYSTYDRSETMQYKSDKLTSSRNRHEGYEISCNGSVTRIRLPGSNQGSDNPLSVVLGCSIGIPLLVIIIAVFVVVLVCRKRRKQEREYDDQNETTTSHPIPSVPQGDGTITTSSHHRLGNVSSNRDQYTPGQQSTADNPPTYISLLSPPPPYSEVAGLTQQETRN